MSKLTELQRNLRPGEVQRRAELARLGGVDRHLRRLLEDSCLEKVSAGIYLAPRMTCPGFPRPRPRR